MGRHHGCDLRRVGCDRHPADLRGFRPAQHMDDHRNPGDVQQRLAGQPCGCHAGGNQHQSAVFGHWARGHEASENMPEIMGIGGKSGRLYGLPEPGQTDISTLLRVQRESLIPDAHSAAVLPAYKSILQGLEPDPIWTPSNSTRLSAPSSAPVFSSSGDELCRQRDFRAHNPEKPGFEIAVKEEAHGGPARPPLRRPSRSRSCCRPRRSRRVPPPPRSARPATPSKRAARTGSARTSTAPSMRRRARQGRLQFLRRDEGQGRQLDV